MKNIIITVLTLFGYQANLAWSQMPPAFDIHAFRAPPSQYALQVLREVQSTVSPDADDVRIYANKFIPNAMAIAIPQMGFDRWGYQTIIGSTRVIYYNPEFMTHLELSSGSKWTAISIIAHEIGHHIAGHTSPRDPWLAALEHPWDRELEADYYSGLSLAMLGAIPEDLQRAQRLMFSLWGNPSHPDSIRRIQAINSGWMQSGMESIESDLQQIWATIQEDLTKWR